MAAHDRIRLTGRLREGPREGPFLLGGRDAAGREGRRGAGGTPRGGRDAAGREGRRGAGGTPRGGREPRGGAVRRRGARQAWSLISSIRTLAFAGRSPLMGLVSPGLGEKTITRGPMSYATRKKPAAGDAYCPHCHLLIERKVGDDWPEEPQRCPHCRLLVGVGRAKPTPT